MKTSLRVLCLVLAIPLVSIGEPPDTKGVLSCDVTAEVKAILSDYEFVGIPANWYAPHGMENNGRHIRWGSALCVFREPTKISPVTGKQEEVPVRPALGMGLTVDVLEGIGKRYNLGTTPHAAAVFARTGADVGEGSAESMIEWYGDVDTSTGMKLSMAITARFVSLQGGKFGILLNYTLLE